MDGLFDGVLQAHPRRLQQSLQLCLSGPGLFEAPAQDQQVVRDADQRRRVFQLAPAPVEFPYQELDQDSS